MYQAKENITTNSHRVTILDGPFQNRVPFIQRDIVITAVEEAPEDFDPRRHAKSKTYIYRVFNWPYRTALSRDRAWWVRHPLDIELMQKGAELFIGKKDFTSFCTAD